MTQPHLTPLARFALACLYLRGGHDGMAYDELDAAVRDPDASPWERRVYRRFRALTSEPVSRRDAAALADRMADILYPEGA